MLPTTTADLDLGLPAAECGLANELVDHVNTAAPALSASGIDLERVVHRNASGETAFTAPIDDEGARLACGFRVRVEAVA